MMAIETGHAGSTQSSAVNGASHALKNRGKGPDASGGGTFSSLLSGLGVAQADDDALAVQASEGAAGSDAPTNSGASSDANAGQPGVPPDAAYLAGMGLAPGADQADAAAASGTQAKGLPGRTARVGGANAPGQPDAGWPGTGPAATETQGLEAPGRLQDASAAASTEQSMESIAELVAGLKAPGSSPDAKAGAPLGPVQGAAASHTPTVGLALRADANPLAAARAAAARAAIGAMGFDSARSAGSGLGLGVAQGRGAAAQADVHDTQSLAAAAAATDATAAVVAQVLAAADAGDGAMQGRGRDKPGTGPSATTGGALAGATADPAAATSAGAPSDLGFAAVAAGQQLTPEEFIAKQVNFWVTQKTQAAELKLDGFGDQPVEVSISLTGNEAQVAFRSDHAGARELLESAMPHLKEMLQSEGLLLSGMSVGTSGKGAADTGGQQGRREPGTGTGQPEPLAAQAALPPRATRPLGVVDVFA